MVTIIGYSVLFGLVMTNIYSSAESQINYILGDTGRSYVCGYKHFYNILHFSSWMFVFCSTYWSTVILVGGQSSSQTAPPWIFLSRCSVSQCRLCPLTSTTDHWLSRIVICYNYQPILPVPPVIGTQAITTQDQITRWTLNNQKNINMVYVDTISSKIYKGDINPSNISRMPRCWMEP